MSTNNINDPKSVFESSTPKFVFRKADLKPGDKKYTEVTAVQVDRGLHRRARRPRRHQGTGGRPAESRSVSG